MTRLLAFVADWIVSAIDLVMTDLTTPEAFKWFRSFRHTFTISRRLPFWWFTLLLLRCAGILPLPELPRTPLGSCISTESRLKGAPAPTPSELLVPSSAALEPTWRLIWSIVAAPSPLPFAAMEPAWRIVRARVAASMTPPAGLAGALIPTSAITPEMGTQLLLPLEIPAKEIIFFHPIL